MEQAGVTRGLVLLVVGVVLVVARNGFGVDDPWPLVMAVAGAALAVAGAVEVFRARRLARSG